MNNTTNSWDSEFEKVWPIPDTGDAHPILKLRESVKDFIRTLLHDTEIAAGEEGYDDAKEIGLALDKAHRGTEKAGRKKPDVCEVCGGKGQICFDHDHKTGKFRGWLCQPCNKILGFANDNPEVLMSLIKYLNGTWFN